MSHARDTVATGTIACVAGSLVNCSAFSRAAPVRERMEAPMNGLIYLVGLIVVIMAILSFFGLR
jgi:hypothetical protein